jgi:pyruvate ferredoxin oxidoreductase delta subunit
MKRAVANNMAKKTISKKDNKSSKAKIPEITIGAIITNPGSSLANKTGSWREFRPVRDASKCIKCGMCWTNCPDNAINTEFVANLDYCKGCGICAQVCPVKCIVMMKEEK